MSPTPDYDCSRKCHYKPHGNCVTSALTKRSISDEKLAAYLAKICRNFYDIVDEQGRSALHLAASVGRYAVLEWLLIQGATINVCDLESGSTPLHRAIFYGNIDCAVLLIRYGASLDTLDEDTRNPLQSICRLCDFSKYREIAASNEVLVWGSNKNYNLGLGNESGSDQPTSIEFFRKQHICIEFAALGAYHSFFLDKKSQLYAVGHGNGGRLGINIENTLTAPKKVKVPIKNANETIINVSVSRKHSLLLTNRSAVYACGLNMDKQLGVRDAGDKITTFKEVVTLRDLGVAGLVRVIALDHYSIAYSEDAIYIWGTNTGQFGMKHNELKIITAPKQMMLPPRTTIKFVEANNSAIALVTKDNLILLMYNGKTRTIKPPNYEDIKSVCLFGGDGDKAAKGMAAALKLLILTTTNVVYLWYEMKQSFFRCIFSQIRLTQIDKIAYKGNQVIILSQGDVYCGKCNQVPVPALIVEHEAKQTSERNDGIWSNNDQNRTEISKEYTIRIDLQRIPIVDRAVDLFCNNDFTSFAVLQESKSKYFKLPTLTAEEYVFKKLYNDSSVYDSVHDIVFYVDDETFAAHKLLIYARAPGLRELIIDDSSESVYLNYDTLTSKMFELILKHIYTNYLPNNDDVDDINKSLGPKSCDNNKTVLQLFLFYVEKFQLKNLMKFLQSHLEDESSYLPLRVDKSKYRFSRLCHKDFPMLYDVRIICENDVELLAHKCILVARLEYFEMMFTHTWAESSLINLKSVPVDYMQPILDFLYTADVEQFRKHNYAQNFLYNMIVFCDQFFIERLRKVCEISILEKINIRNCGEMLDFAVMYNCDVLKRGCLDFICQNLSRILSYRSLEECDAEALCCINGCYQKMFKDVFDYRVITPDSQAIDDELLLCFVDDFTVNLQEPVVCDQEYNHKNTLKQQKSQDTSRTNNPKHKYERDAISNMIYKELEQRKPRNTLSESQATLEIQRTDVINWIKVGDKKDGKKRHTSEQSEKMNITIPSQLNANASANEKYVFARTTPEKEVEVDVNKDYAPPITKLNSISLSEFTPTKEKLSQKQRKRLVSNSCTTVVSPTSATPMQKELQQNAWGILPPQTSISDEPHLSVNAVSPITGSTADPTSFANMIRGSSAATSSSAISADNNSFSKILADERKQRDYFERMRNKSLVLTQIEEMAIDELHKFYNVDNVTDEVITIARKPREVSINFAVWQRN